MNIRILDRQVELANEIASIEKLYDLIEEAISDGEYHFSHIVVDGIDVYEDLEGYIEDNIGSIEEIVVVTMTISEFVSELIVTSREYFDRAIPAIENLSDEFYSEPNVKDWDNIRELFDGISWIFKAFKSIDSLENLNDIVSDYEAWNNYAKEVHALAEFLPELEEALENEDNVLIGDLLSYEIAPIFQNMKSALADIYRKKK